MWLNTTAAPYRHNCEIAAVDGDVVLRLFICFGFVLVFFVVGVVFFWILPLITLLLQQTVM